MERPTYIHIDIQIDRQANGHTDRQTDIQTYIHADLHIYIQTNGHANLQIDRQTDR